MSEESEPKDLSKILNIKEGTRIQISWTLEDTETETSEQVWWPATVGKSNGDIVELSTTNDQDEDISVEIVDVPIKYDTHEKFPEWNGEEDLISSVCFLHNHVLMENGMGKGTFWRFENDSWNIDNPLVVKEGEPPIPLDDVPEALGNIIIDTIAVPFFDTKYRTTCEQKMYSYDRLAKAKEEFVRVLKEQAQQTPGYLATLTDEMLYEVLKKVGANLCQG